MNPKDIRTTNRIAHAEYQDARGYTHIEYKDAQGNIYTEYTDSRGNVHTYKNSYANGHLAEERRQAERESRAGSNGLLAGILISCVGVIALGTIYAMTRPEEVEELPPVVNVETPAPAPVEREVEQPNVTIVPVTQPAAQPTPQPVAQQPAATPQQPPAQSPAQPSNVNVTVTNPQNPQQPTAPKAAPTTATSSPTPATQTPAITDASLKADIAKKFQNSLPNNQLMTTVNNGEVTITGTVMNQEQLQQISPLLSSVTGIKKVTNNATVAP